MIQKSSATFRTEALTPPAAGNVVSQLSLPEEITLGFRESLPRLCLLEMQKTGQHRGGQEGWE